MTVSKRLRFEILTRDGHVCRYCGGRAPDVKLTVDHVLPLALGGSDDPTNLVAACAACNAGKSSVPAGASLVADVANDALRWAAAIAHCEAERMLALDDSDRVAAQFDEAWCSWRTNNGEGDVLPRDGDWRGSVDLWLKRGMTIEHLVRYIPTAMNRPVRDTWSWYCGIVWKAITQIQEEARAVLEADSEVPAGDVAALIF